jgi:glucose-6-phosphate dehydrogenase assembly protein OpcA
MDATRFELPVQHGPGTATVATLNLVGYLGSQEHRGPTLARLEAIARKYPSRLFVLDPIPEGTLSVPSSVFDVTADGRRININLAAQDVGGIGSVVSESVVRHIPTVLWWDSLEPVSSVFVEQMGNRLDEVIVDTSTHPDRDRAVEQLRNFQNTFTRVALRDLAWLRGAEWRKAVIRLFDDHVAQEHVRGMRVIEIIGGGVTEAGYIGGWLASRLGWVNERGLGFCTREGRLVRFVHTADPDRAQITEIRLASAFANFRLVLERNGMALTCFSQVEADASPPRHMPFHQAEDAELVEQAILMRGTDELFEASLRSLCIK